MSSDTAELLRQHVDAVAKAVNPEKPDREKKEDVGETGAEHSEK